MPDRVFIDTNLWIYLFLKSEKEKDIEKRDKVKLLIEKHSDIVISNQVLNEVVNVLNKKYEIENDHIEKYLRKLLNIADLHYMSED